MSVKMVVNGPEDDKICSKVGLKLYIPPHPPTRNWYKDSKLDVNSSLPLPATVRPMKASHYSNLL